MADPQVNVTNPTINLITNIAGFLVVVLEPIRAYLETQPFNWGTFGICVMGAVLLYFKGKS